MSIYPSINWYTNSHSGDEVNTCESQIGLRNNLMWLNLQAKKVGNIGAFTRGGLNFGQGGNSTFLTEPVRQGGEFKFLMPNTWTEVLSHQWKPYEHLAGVAANEMAGAIKGFENIVDIGTGAINSIIDVFKKNGGKYSDFASAINSIFNSSKMKVDSSQKFKIDTPLIYDTTERRRYTFSVLLADEGQYDSPYENIIEPIKNLQYFSCAGARGGVSGMIDWPYVFEIKTTWGVGNDVKELLYINNAALLNIQANYDKGYRGNEQRGTPRYCELVLDFVDVEPIYRDNIIIGSRGEKLMFTFNEKGSKTP